VNSILKNKIKVKKKSSKLFKDKSEELHGFSVVIAATVKPSHLIIC
jgi:hypothetical protein